MKRALPRVKICPKCGSVDTIKLETLKKKGIRPKGQPPTEKRARGEQNGSWKGGVLTLNQKLRKSLEYKLWRESVFKRDNFTCIWCKAHSGSGKAVILHADHIKMFALYPKLRFEISNGQTLCVRCHAWKTKMDKKIYLDKLPIYVA